MANITSIRLWQVKSDKDFCVIPAKQTNNSFHIARKVLSIANRIRNNLILHVQTVTYSHRCAWPLLKMLLAR